MSATNLYDPLGANMEEVVAALSTQQERDELTHFVEEHLKRGTGAGILRGLFLLLKANRCYLEKLPGKFNQELVQPILQNVLRLENSLGLHMKSQDTVIAGAKYCVESVTKAADRMEAIVPKVEEVVQTAFDKIDSTALTKKMENAVMEGAVKPVAKVNRECELLQVKLERQLPVLTGALKWLSIGNFVVWALSCLCFIGMTAIYNVASTERDMVIQLQHRVKEEVEKVHANAQVNEETLSALARLNVALQIAPEKDWRGELMPNHYCIAIKGADSGNTIYKDGEKYGAIFLREQITPLDLR